MPFVLEPLILLINNFQECLSFRAPKIDVPRPFWYQTNSTGLVNSSPENEMKTVIKIPYMAIRTLR